MHRRIRIYILTFIVFLTGFALESKAQFKEEAFKQTYNEKSDSTAVTDTAAKLFSFKEWGRGLAHKEELKVGTVFAGSTFAPGTAQIYNKDYWKLPIIYGGLGAFAGTGGYYLHKYKTTGNPSYKTTATWLFAGAGVVYWGSLMDGIASFETEVYPDPGKAALYSALCPGLGQIYNGELFKVPIYWGGLLVSGHLLVNFNTNYKRFKRIHNMATSDDPEIRDSTPINGETAKWYRDVYRRYRDYSIVATALVYVLQILDANVFAYMHDFDVTDDISMNIEPALISPYNEYAINTPVITNPMNNAVGMKVGIRF